MAAMALFQCTLKVCCWVPVQQAHLRCLPSVQKSKNWKKPPLKPSHAWSPARTDLWMPAWADQVNLCTRLPMRSLYCVTTWGCCLRSDATLTVNLYESNNIMIHTDESNPWFNNAVPGPTSGCRSARCRHGHDNRKATILRLSSAPWDFPACFLCWTETVFPLVTTVVPKTAWCGMITDIGDIQKNTSLPRLKIAQAPSNTCSFWILGSPFTSWSRTSQKVILLRCKITLAPALPQLRPCKVERNLPQLWLQIERFGIFGVGKLSVSEPQRMRDVIGQEPPKWPLPLRKAGKSYVADYSFHSPLHCLHWASTACSLLMAASSASISPCVCAVTEAMAKARTDSAYYVALHPDATGRQAKACKSRFEATQHTSKNYKDRITPHDTPSSCVS